MRTVLIISTAFCVVLLSAPGCREPVRKNADPAAAPVYGLWAYGPTKIDIVPLTELLSAGDSEDIEKVVVYVDVLDEFDSQIKSPAVWRFELYEYVPRSAEAKGERLIIWPDIDLTEAKANNSYWRDFLWAYQFELDLPIQLGKNHSYILQAMCFCQAGKRLTAAIRLRTQ